MATDTTDHSLKKYLQDWQPSSVVVVAVLAFALCVALYAAVQAPAHVRTVPVPKSTAPLVADMSPVVPWRPVSAVNSSPKVPEHR